jgi:hypothetical protein
MLVIVTLITIIVIMALENDDTPLPGEILPTADGRGIVITPENVDEMREQLQERVEDGYYASRMNVEWVFETWNSPSNNAFVENQLKNTRTVYFDLIVDDTDELVYSSPFIPVGAKLERFTLDRELPAGEHPATVTYHLVDDNYENITEVSVAVLLKILG